jgi:hypothetical protein
MLAGLLLPVVVGLPLPVARQTCRHSAGPMTTYHAPILVVVLLLPVARQNCRHSAGPMIPREEAAPALCRPLVLDLVVGLDLALALCRVDYPLVQRHPAHYLQAVGPPLF